jgi:hypothetical protein
VGYENGQAPLELSTSNKFPYEKVRNILSNVRKYSQFFNPEEIASLLSNQDSMVLYPKAGDMDEWKTQQETLYVLSSPQLIQNAQNNLSSVIGLDSFYKLCTDGWAIGVLVCPNKNNHYDPFGKRENQKKK